MKQFIYLNTDIVNSVIAQEGKGLVDAFTTEKELKREKSKKNKENVQASGMVGGSIWKLAKAEVSLSLNGELESASSQQNATREIIAKTLHDAAFDIAYKALTPVTIDNEDHALKPGMYIEIVRNFDFLDFDYLDNLFSKGGIIDYLKKTEKEKLKLEANNYAENNLNRLQKRNGATNALAKVVSEQEKECDKQYDDIHGAITAIKNVMPYSRMLSSNDGFLVPTEESFFRVNPASLGIMYGGEIKCVGMITNVINDNDNVDDTNAFATMQSAINEAIRTILPTKEEKIYVVSPIALFYENNNE